MSGFLRRTMKIFQALLLVTLFSILACSGTGYRYPVGTADQCQSTNPFPTEMKEADGYKKAATSDLVDGYYIYQGADLYMYDQQNTKTQIYVRESVDTTGAPKAGISCTRNRLNAPKMDDSLKNLTR